VEERSKVRENGRYGSSEIADSPRCRPASAGCRPRSARRTRQQQISETGIELPRLLQSFAGTAAVAGPRWRRSVAPRTLAGLVRLDCGDRSSARPRPPVVVARLACHVEGEPGPNGPRLYRTDHAGAGELGLEPARSGHRPSPRTTSRTACRIAGRCVGLARAKDPDQHALASGCCTTGLSMTLLGPARLARVIAVHVAVATVPTATATTTSQSQPNTAVLR